MARDHHQLRKLAIVPAYNEQGMVGRVVRDIHRHAPDFDVVVIDDGSLVKEQAPKDEIEMLQDLIVAAVNDAHHKVDEEMAQKMGGMLPPGMKL